MMIYPIKHVGHLYRLIGYFIIRIDHRLKRIVINLYKPYLHTMLMHDSLLHTYSLVLFFLPVVLILVIIIKTRANIRDRLCLYILVTTFMGIGFFFTFPVKSRCDKYPESS